MASASKLPRDTTSPLFYAPIALLATAIVVAVFVSGYGTAQFGALVSEKWVPPVKEGRRAVNVQALATNVTPEILAEGKTLYEVNCASCHGVTGYGNGERGANLNPPPRNFHDSQGWKNGYSIPGMWKTLEEGIAGGSMAAYRLLPPHERMAMIHYIRSAFLSDIDVPPPTAEEIAMLPGAGAAAATAADIPPAPEPVIPVRQAISLVSTQGRQPLEEAPLPASLAQMPGAALYGLHCASCHGSAGQGVAAGRTLGTYPIVRVPTGPLVGANGPWRESFEAFRELMVHPQPGTYSHDFATLSQTDLKALHEFLNRLAGLRDHAALNPLQNQHSPNSPATPEVVFSR